MDKDLPTEVVDSTYEEGREMRAYRITYSVTGDSFWVSSEAKAKQMAKDKGGGTVVPYDIPTRLSDLLDFLNKHFDTGQKTVDNKQEDRSKWPDDLVVLQRQVIERLQEQLDALLPPKESQPKKGK